MSLYEKATPRPWRAVPWHIEEGPSACRAPAGHVCGTFASDVDAEMVAYAVNNIEAQEAEIGRLTAENTTMRATLNLIARRKGAWQQPARAALSPVLIEDGEVGK